MKLSKNQKQVLSTIRNGYKFQVSFAKPILFKNGHVIPVSYSVIDKLEELGLLASRHSNITNRFIYSLTELGKTIEL